jgi:hypothetical protein
MPRTLARRALTALLLASPCLAFASGSFYKPAPLPPKYKQECGTCHVAYPASLLHAASWQRVMGNLKNHYGTSVALDADSAAQISDWLRANAGTNLKMMGEPAEDRLTRTHWFKLEHHDVQPADWTLPKVKSASNCVACHHASPNGIYDEYAVKIPR